MALKKPTTPKPKPLREPVASPAAGRLWFEPLLDLISRPLTQVVLRKGDVVYTQGQKSDGVFFVKKGRVRRSVLSKAGQEAILDDLVPGEFCGEGCLSGQALRVSSATALTAAIVVKVEHAVLAKALREVHALSEAFLVHLLARNVSVEKDICGQLFNHLERRLACVLLKLSRLGQPTTQTAGRTASATMSQQGLAKMIGTSRSRISAIMTQFRRLGLIDYGGDLPAGTVVVHPALLNAVVLVD
ncbi:MAG TPA: Crp/Fnr family transcriptional regulator [Terriglobales bacterium]|nr:Crp/Fnr family transcriptional regulator [Terriglobales bacterium]